MLYVVRKSSQGKKIYLRLSPHNTHPPSPAPTSPAHTQTHPPSSQLPDTHPLQDAAVPTHLPSSQHTPTPHTPRTHPHPPHTPTGGNTPHTQAYKRTTYNVQLSSSHRSNRPPIELFNRNRWAGRSVAFLKPFRRDGCFWHGCVVCCMCSAAHPGKADFTYP